MLSFEKNRLTKINGKNFLDDVAMKNGEDMPSGNDSTFDQTKNRATICSNYRLILKKYEKENQLNSRATLGIIS